MAQHDYDIANQSGSSFRADLNNALDAIASNNSGSSEPSTTFAYEWWIDTSANVLKLRNSANNAWITLPLSITADNSTSGALTVNGNLTTTGTVDINGQELILDADADTSITADTDDQIDFRVGAVDVMTLTNSHLVLKGTTPKITIGDGGEEDTALIFDGNAQDFYIGLDDSADDLVIGKGSTVGTTPAIEINDSLNATFNNNVLVGAPDSGKLFFLSSSGFSPRIQGDTNDLAFFTNNSERVRILSTGRIGVGTTSPDVLLDVRGEAAIAYNAQYGLRFYNQARNNWSFIANRMTSGLANLYFGTGGGNMVLDNSGNLTVGGSISKNSGSFKIDHPLESKKDTHNLIHSFVEAPQADNIYRGVVSLENGSATINLDTVSGMTEGTYVLLNTNTQCFTSNETDWDAVKGSVTDNILTISCENTSSTATVSWLVIGERHDQHMIDTDWTDENGKVIVEKLKEAEE